MEQSESPFKPVVDVLTQALQHVTETLTKGITEMDHRLTDQYCGLIQRCAAMEAMQLALFSALAETNPAAHAKIIEEIKNTLIEIDGSGRENHGFTDYLRAMSGINAESKPLLRLVPKKSLSPE